ncbi:MAG: sigma 54-interacting transcriptional regulator, partial [Pseudomonadota bacterium]
VEASGSAGGSVGLMEQAHGGTLMFDEIGDMPIETQRKILRVLTEQRFKRVGGSEPVTVDVRIVSATARDLLAEASEGRFREDLYHRLNVVPISAPSLAERREDVPALVDHFLDRFCRAGGFARRSMSMEAMAALQSYHWPGNVLQLRNVIERVLILSNRESSQPISCDDLPAEIIDSGLSIPAGEGLEQIIALPLREARERFEREYLIAQINRFGGNISRTANFIGMERSALHRKLKALGVTSQQRAESATA